MALIENLEHEGWEKFFRDSFQYALEVLKNDRFRPVGSSVDDLKSWLTAGGSPGFASISTSRWKCAVFPSSRKSAVNDCIEQLVQENRGALLDLMADGIVPDTRQKRLEACGLSEQDFQDILSRIIAGERPFEEWMHAHGHSDEDIEDIYRIIDQWLMQKGIIPH